MWLETKIKEHMDASRKGEFDKSAITEHACKFHQPILWDETLVIDRTGKWIVCEDVCTSNLYLQVS